MKCYDCNVEVEPRAYPEGRCPVCDLSYILSDDHWQICEECGEPPASDGMDGLCLDCYLK